MGHIEAVEINAQPGSEPLYWKLLSSIPCADAAAVQRQLGWYAQRWSIEVFHRTLKIGCQSEARRLGSLEELERALSLDLIVAWRLMALRAAARQQPEAPRQPVAGASGVRSAQRLGHAQSSRDPAPAEHRPSSALNRETGRLP